MGLIGVSRPTDAKRNGCYDIITNLELQKNDESFFPVSRRYDDVLGRGG